MKTCILTTSSDDSNVDSEPPGHARPNSMKIHQVRTRLSNSYVVDHGDKLFVVDVGFRCHEYVLGYIEHEMERPASDVELVICTHDDADHIGGVRHLALACSAEFALPFASRHTLRKNLNDPAGSFVRLGTSMLEASRPRAWRMYMSPGRQSRLRRRPRKRVRLSSRDVGQLRPSLRLRHGMPLPGFEDWTVVHTPGHSWDSCCFHHAESGALLSGDTLLGSSGQEQLVFPSIFSNRRQMRRTLEKLRTLEVRSVYPGHGSAFHGDDLFDAL